MVDVVDRSTRSRMMSGIRGKNTSPELVIRSGLHRRGFRYLLHAKDLPGRPDLVFPRFNALVLVHGCFWHRHNCGYFKWPTTRAQFWREKILGNVRRDRKILLAYARDGWRVAIIWECATKNASIEDEILLIDRLQKWLEGKRKRLEITG